MIIYAYPSDYCVSASVTCAMNYITNSPKIIVLKAVYIALFKLAAVLEAISDRGI